MSVSHAVSREVMEALDMPRDLQAVQDAYHQARREWEELDHAYRLVVNDMLKRVEYVSNQESIPKEET